MMLRTIDNRAEIAAHLKSAKSPVQVCIALVWSRGPVGQPFVELYFDTVQTMQQIDDIVAQYTAVFVNESVTVRGNTVAIVPDVEIEKSRARNKPSKAG